MEGARHCQALQLPSWSHLSANATFSATQRLTDTPATASHREPGSSESGGCEQVVYNTRPYCLTYTHDLTCRRRSPPDKGRVAMCSRMCRGAMEMNYLTLPFFQSLKTKRILYHLQRCGHHFCSPSKALPLRLEAWPLFWLGGRNTCLCWTLASFTSFFNSLLQGPGAT